MGKPELCASEHSAGEGGSLEERKLQDSSPEPTEVSTQGDEPQTEMSSAADADTLTQSSSGSNVDTAQVADISPSGSLTLNECCRQKPRVHFQERRSSTCVLARRQLFDGSNCRATSKQAG